MKKVDQPLNGRFKSMHTVSILEVCGNENDVGTETFGLGT